MPTLTPMPSNPPPPPPPPRTRKAIDTDTDRCTTLPNNCTPITHFLHLNYCKHQIHYCKHRFHPHTHSHAHSRYIAAGLLDASIRVIFFDSFKPYLTLYGHKLPVLSVSASSDSTLLVSGSADKTVKIWGLDFGDCHRSLYAHTESVMSVQFVRETHYFFSTGKDKLIKYWDADRFEQILTMRGHHAEVWGAVSSRSGDVVASLSRDRSLRLWRRTDEQVFIAEEKENELEELFEAGLEKQQQSAEAEEAEAEAQGLEGGGEATAAGKKTLDSVKGAERLLEALQTLAEDEERRKEFEQAVALWKKRADIAKATRAQPPKRPVLVPNLLLLGLDEGGYLLKALSSIRAAEVEQALLLLPFESVNRLLTRLLPLIASAPYAELTTRCVLFVLKVHHKTIVANRSMVGLLQKLDVAVRGRVEKEQATIGYNLAAMRFVKSSVEAETSSSFFEDSLAAKQVAGSTSTTELRRQTNSRKQPRKK